MTYFSRRRLNIPLRKAALSPSRILPQNEAIKACFSRQVNNLRNGGGQSAQGAWVPSHPRSSSSKILSKCFGQNPPSCLGKFEAHAIPSNEVL